MIIRNYDILASEGMHARPATALVKLAREFKSTILLEKGPKTIKLNSLLNILSMGIKGGETIILSVEGEDEDKAIAALDDFFKDNLKDW